MSIRVIVNGAHGKMGKIAISAVNQTPDLTLVGQTDRDDSIAEQIKQQRADVVIDFTTPQAVFANAQMILEAGARAVVGTTGLTVDQIDILRKLCIQNQLGAIIAPNFSLGALLMMRYAEDAARYLPDVEIIEMHHPQKLDAPSGTAIKTAQMMERARTEAKSASSGLPPARGENHNGVQVHSVRLPGFYSHQTVIFGNEGEILTLAHQGIDRKCCIPGIALACRSVVSLSELVYGLENILFSK